MEGIQEKALYRIHEVDWEQEELLKDTGRVVSGAVLMHAGLKIERMWGDFRSKLLYLKKEEVG